MTENRVVVQDNTVVVTGLTIADEEVVQYVSRFPDEKKPDAVIRATEVGVALLERYEAARNMDFLRQQAEAVISAVTAAAERVPAKVQEDLMQKLGTKDGQALAPVAGLVNQTEKVLREKLLEVQTLLNDHIDPRRSDSTLGKALDTLKTMLDPKHDDSVQKAVETAVLGITGEHGTLAQSVKKVVEDSLKPLQLNIDSLAREIHGQEAVSEALEQTTAKGKPFEEDLLPLVQLWASMAGAEVDHVGPDNLPGDILVIMDSSRMTTTDLRIVIEARDDKTSRGKKRVLDDMAEAMGTRKADYGIYVACSATALAKEIGDWAELHCQHGPVIACTAENLRTALRFAVAECRLRQLKASAPQADTATIEMEVSRMRASLGRVRSINTKVTVIKTSADTITEEADHLKKEISDSLIAIEESMRIAEDVALNQEAPSEEAVV